MRYEGIPGISHLWPVSHEKETIDWLLTNIESIKEQQNTGVWQRETTRSVQSFWPLPAGKCPIALSWYRHQCHFSGPENLFWSFLWLDEKSSIWRDFFDRLRLVAGRKGLSKHILFLTAPGDSHRRWFASYLSKFGIFDYFIDMGEANSQWVREKRKNVYWSLS